MQQSPKVLFMPVNSTASGSVQLRELNAMSSIQNALYSDPQTVAAQYCKIYDESGKKNEPFYDVLAAQIATDTEFDKNFAYVPVKLITTGSNANSFHSQQEDPLVCKMVSTTFDGLNTVTRKYLETEFNYSSPSTEHIFIYGPITDHILQILFDKMNSAISNDTMLIIHVQGENTLDEKGKAGDTEFGMKSKGNLYSNAFNYQNQITNACRLRNFIQTSPNCMAFTMICKTSPELLTNEVNGEILTDSLPKVFLKYYEDIGELLNGSFSNNDNYYKTLNVVDIFQDMVDKDNITSVAFLLLNAINLDMCQLHLIGREAFALLYKGQVVPHHNIMNFALIPDKIKPDSIVEKVKNIELNMAQPASGYWPSFKTDEFDLMYEPMITRTHYKLATTTFGIALKDILQHYHREFNNINSDCETLIPNPSVTEERLCMLNETLFIPYINIYLASIGKKNPELLSVFDESVNTIKDSKSYMSDIQLAELCLQSF